MKLPLTSGQFHFVGIGELMSGIAEVLHIWVITRSRAPIWQEEHRNVLRALA